MARRLNAENVENNAYFTHGGIGKEYRSEKTKEQYNTGTRRTSKHSHNRRCIELREVVKGNAFYVLPNAQRRENPAKVSFAPIADVCQSEKIMCLYRTSTSNAAGNKVSMRKPIVVDSRSRSRERLMSNTGYIGRKTATVSAEPAKERDGSVHLPTIPATTARVSNIGKISGENAVRPSVQQGIFVLADEESRKAEVLSSSGRGVQIEGGGVSTAEQSSVPILKAPVVTEPSQTKIGSTLVRAVRNRGIENRASKENAVSNAPIPSTSVGATNTLVADVVSVASTGSPLRAELLNHTARTRTSEVETEKQENASILEEVPAEPSEVEISHIPAKSARNSRIENRVSEESTVGATPASPEEITDFACVRLGRDASGGDSISGEKDGLMVEPLNHLAGRDDKENVSITKMDSDRVGILVRNEEMRQIGALLLQDRKGEESKKHITIQHNAVVHKLVDYDTTVESTGSNIPTNDPTELLACRFEKVEEEEERAKSTSNRKIGGVPLSVVQKAHATPSSSLQVSNRPYVETDRKIVSLAPKRKGEESIGSISTGTAETVPPQAATIPSASFVIPDVPTWETNSDTKVSEIGKDATFYVNEAEGKYISRDITYDACGVNALSLMLSSLGRFSNIERPAWAEVLIGKKSRTSQCNQKAFVPWNMAEIFYAIAVANKAVNNMFPGPLDVLKKIVSCFQKGGKPNAVPRELNDVLLEIPAHVFLPFCSREYSGSQSLRDAFDCILRKVIEKAPVKVSNISVEGKEGSFLIQDALDLVGSMSDIVYTEQQKEIDALFNEYNNRNRKLTLENKNKLKNLVLKPFVTRLMQCVLQKYSELYLNHIGIEKIQNAVEEILNSWDVGVTTLELLNKELQSHKSQYTRKYLLFPLIGYFSKHYQEIDAVLQNLKNRDSVHSTKIQHEIALEATNNIIDACVNTEEGVSYMITNQHRTGKNREKTYWLSSRDVADALHVFNTCMSRRYGKVTDSAMCGEKLRYWSKDIGVIEYPALLGYTLDANDRNLSGKSAERIGQYLERWLIARDTQEKKIDFSERKNYTKDLEELRKALPPVLIVSADSTILNVEKYFQDTNGVRRENAITIDALAKKDINIAGKTYRLYAAGVYGKNHYRPHVWDYGQGKFYCSNNFPVDEDFSKEDQGSDIRVVSQFILVEEGFESQGTVIPLSGGAPVFECAVPSATEYEQYVPPQREVRDVTALPQGSGKTVEKAYNEFQGNFNAQGFCNAIISNPNNLKGVSGGVLRVSLPPGVYIDADYFGDLRALLRPLYRIGGKEYSMRLLFLLVYKGNGNENLAKIEQIKKKCRTVKEFVEQLKKEGIHCDTHGASYFEEQDVVCYVGSGEIASIGLKYDNSRLQFVNFQGGVPGTSCDLGLSEVYLVPMQQEQDTVVDGEKP